MLARALACWHGFRPADTWRKFQVPEISAEVASGPVGASARLLRDPGARMGAAAAEAAEGARTGRPGSIKRTRSPRLAAATKRLEHLRAQRKKDLELVFALGQKAVWNDTGAEKRRVVALYEAIEDVDLTISGAEEEELAARQARRRHRRRARVACYAG